MVGHSEAIRRSAYLSANRARAFKQPRLLPICRSSPGGTARTRVVHMIAQKRVHHACIFAPRLLLAPLPSGQGALIDADVRYGLLFALSRWSFDAALRVWPRGHPPSVAGS